MVDKKGVEMSVNTIIIFALAILILIIVAYLIIHSVEKGNQANDCVGHQGTCVDFKTACGPNSLTSTWICSGSNQRCCVPV